MIATFYQTNPPEGRCPWEDFAQKMDREGRYSSTAVEEVAWEKDRKIETCLEFAVRIDSTTDFR